MAKLPTVENFGARPTPTSPRTVIPFRSGIAESAAVGQIRQLGQAQQETFETVGKLAKGFAKAERDEAIKRQKAQDTLAVTRAKSRHLAADLATREALANDPDFATHENRYNAAMDKAGKEIEETFGARDDLKALYQASVVDSRTRGIITVRSAARKKSEDAGRADLGEQLDINKGLFISGATPNERAEVILMSKRAIISAQEAGYITAEKAGEMGRTTAVDYAQGFLTTQPPEVQMRMTGGDKPVPDFTSVTKTSIDFLSAEQREKIYESARKEIIAEESRRIRLEDRAFKFEEREAKRVNDEFRRFFSEADTVDDKERVYDAAVENRTVSSETIERMREGLKKYGSGILSDPQTVRDTWTGITTGGLTEFRDIPDAVDDEDRKAMERAIVTRRSSLHFTRSNRWALGERRLRFALGIPDAGFAIMDSKARQAMARLGQALLQMQDAGLQAEKDGTVGQNPDRPGEGEFDPIEVAKTIIEDKIKPETPEDAANLKRLNEIDDALTALRSDESLSATDRKKKREELAAERAQIQIRLGGIE